METQEHSLEETDFTMRVNKGLARLYLGKVLKSENWLSDHNRDSISRMTHYDNLFPPCRGSELTFGELLATIPRYITDTCIRIIGDQSTMTREKFLASFLEKLLDKDPNEMLQISRDLNSLEPEKKKQFLSSLGEFLVRRQIPAEDVFLALGIHSLQIAHDQKLIFLGRNELKRIANPA